MTHMERRPKVFISHASTDTWVAAQIEGHIQRCGAETFLDAVHIHHGDAFDARIIEAARDSTEMLVLFTPAARERRYIWTEIGMFMVAEKRIVAVLYGVTPDELATDRLTPVTIKGLDSVLIDDLDSYFTQLRGRVAAWEANHG
ncbi:toll/interleukin-1 receptor domain-containing protein [Longimicrobium sp.]|uniref:toll/interleukin-1 receptor domain-containing protein n=1 Tax=Longimicrobium sp. TaxID=2029185 RepID=UPI003B3AFAFC